MAEQIKWPIKASIYGMTPEPMFQDRSGRLVGNGTAFALLNDIPRLRRIEEAARALCDHIERGPGNMPANSYYLEQACLAGRISAALKEPQ